MKPAAHLASKRLSYQNRIGFRMQVLAGLLGRGAKAFLSREHRMSFSNWQVLAVIGQDGPLTAKDVTLRTRQAPDRITRTIDHFENLSLVTRHRDPEDRRRVVLTVSAKGRRIYERVEQVVREANYRMLSVLTAREQAQLDRLLRKYEQAAEALLEHPGSWHHLVASIKKKR